MDNSSIYVALNIGSSVITAMAVRKNEEGQLHILSVEEGKSEGVRYGEIVNPTSTGMVVDRLLKLLQNRIGSKIDRVYVGLNGRSLKTLRALTDRQLSKGAVVTEQLLAEMFAEIEKTETEQGAICGIYEQEIKLNGEVEASPLGCVCEQIDTTYRVIVAKPELKPGIGICFEKAGCKLADTPVQIAATADALLSHLEKEQGCCLIDFGAQCTSFAIFHQGFLRYLAVIPFGGKNITKDIISFNIPEKVAEQLKIQFGDAIASGVDPLLQISIKSQEEGSYSVQISLRMLAYVIEARVNEILNLLLIHIEKSGLLGQLKSGFVITGNACRLKNLDAFIQQKMQLPVRIGSHSRYLEDGSDERYHDISYSPLIGMLLNADIDCSDNDEEKQFEETESAKSMKEAMPKRTSILNKFKDKLTSGFDELFNDAIN